MSTDEIKGTGIIVQCAVGGYDDNFSYCLIDSATKDAAVVDPTGDLSIVEQVLVKYGATLQMLLITHSHFDHVDGIVPLVQRNPSLTIFAHTNTAERIISPTESLELVAQGDVITLGETRIHVLYTPGHIDDAVCYYEKTHKGVGALFTGDTLFVEGCGRTNAHDVKDLWHSLEKIIALPDDTIIFPGHDYGSRPCSTVLWEKEQNPYALCEDFDAFKAKRLG